VQFNKSLNGTHPHSEDRVSQALNRRAFLGRSLTAGAGLAVLGVGGSTLLSACGSDSTSSATGSTTGSADLGTLDYQLSWIKNVEFAGQYIADTNGYYKDAGFSSVNLMAGGPTVQQDAVVASGKALLGIGAPDITAPAILKGAPLKIIAVLFQKNPFCVMSLASNPIATPQDMVGKSIGVQAVNEPVWNSFLKANNLQDANITKVPAQFDPQPLVAGEVDGWFSFVTNEPNLLAVQGVKTTTFLLNDYNYPLVSQTYMTTTDNIKNKADALKAVLLADIKGWQASIKDPALGAQLAVEQYGKDLGLEVEEQTLESKSQNELIVTADTKVNGIMTATDTLLEETISTLALGGTTISMDQLFDLSLLDAVYAENPSLKTLPS
jgi:ABC-type nitrate/sulfonate/bicarbonate transport system substrate-binding protein